MKQGNPFKRAIALFAALAAVASNKFTPGQLALADGGYRGKGEGYISNKNAKSSFKQNKRRGL